MTSEKPNPNQQETPEPEVKTPVSVQSAGIPAPAPEHPEQQDTTLSPEVDAWLAGEAAVAEKTEDEAVSGSTNTSSSPDSTTDTTTTETPDQASAATQSAAQTAAQDSDQGTDAPQFFKVGDDVSQFTGRPRMTAADNQALRDGSHIVKKAMHTMAHAYGEEYEPFRLPAKMRAALAQIDHEAELERQKEQEAEAAAAAAAGKPLPAEDPAAKANTADDPFTKMHSLTPDEQAEAEKLYAEQARIKAGGARFYGKYQKLMADQEVRKEENRMRTTSFLVITAAKAASKSLRQHCHYRSTATPLWCGSMIVMRTLRSTLRLIRPMKALRP